MLALLPRANSCWGKTHGPVLPCPPGSAEPQTGLSFAPIRVLGLQTPSVQANIRNTALQSSFGKAAEGDIGVTCGPCVCRQDNLQQDLEGGSRVQYIPSLEAANYIIIMHLGYLHFPAYISLHHGVSLGRNKKLAANLDFTEMNGFLLFRLLLRNVEI